MYELISLKLKCPVCGKSLMDDEHLVDNEPSILLNIEIEGNKGHVVDTALGILRAFSNKNDRAVIWCHPADPLFKF